MPLNLQQMVWDLQRRVDQLEQEFASDRAATVRERLQPEAQPPTTGPLTPDQRAARILQAIEETFGVPAVILGEARAPESIMPARKAAAVLLREHHFMLREIGVYLGGKAYSNAQYLLREAAKEHSLSEFHNLLKKARQRAKELTQ